MISYPTQFEFLKILFNFVHDLQINFLNISANSPYKNDGSDGKGLSKNYSLKERKRNQEGDVVNNKYLYLMTFCNKKKIILSQLLPF